MSSQIHAIPTCVHDHLSNRNCHLADFVPNFWGDNFLSCPPHMDVDATTQRHHEELKQEVRRMLAKPAIDQPSQKLHLVDAVQRLGVAYHFQQEIDDALETIYRQCKDDQKDHDLYTAAIQFRLLREHGFNVNCEDTFSKFRDEKGNFKESLISGVRGLLELYEATQFRVHGEDLLEQALNFTTFHLKLAAETMLEHPLSTEVANALKRPLRKNLPRLVARSYISIYEAYGTEDETLLKFAKLDFKLLQNLHRKELSEINLWWKSIDVPGNFPFARDRLVECYMWINGVYFEPHYSLGRTFMTKVLALTSVVDDIYDAYGTYEELLPFTDAIQRWDINCIDHLPNYMQVWYRVTFKVYKEIEDLLKEQGKSYRIELAKEAFKQLVQAYLTEAKWLHENYTPTLEEYLSVALVSSTHHHLAVTSFVGMEDDITEETFLWTFNYPKILKASTIVCRLMDDIVTHKFERQRAHVASAIECYTKQHGASSSEQEASAMDCYMKQYGASEQEAYDDFNKKITDAWKDINEEFLKPIAVPEPALTRILNLTRMIDLVYKDEDAYTIVGEAVRTSIASLLIDPIPI